MPKTVSPPGLPPETWRALLSASSDFSALKPWEFVYDCEPVGLIDPVTGETCIGNVLGNAGEVFSAIFYRREGLRWILSMLADPVEPEDINLADGIDCLQVEFVTKRELWKEDLAALKSVGFKPVGRGMVWPQFRTFEPGWHPWHINETEAGQILADLPRLTSFCRLLMDHRGLFENRDPTEIPFLPRTLPDRPLVPEDLDWRPLLVPPSTGLEPFQASTDQLDELRALKRSASFACEFDCTMLPGGSFLKNGRPCFGRFSLLVERKHGSVVGMDMASGAIATGEAAGHALVKALLMAQQLPETIYIGGERLQPVLQPLCDQLKITLRVVGSLPMLDQAVADLGEHMMGEKS